jgi:hypothetical protein
MSTHGVLDEYSQGTHGVLCGTRLGVGERGGGAVGLCDGDVHLFLRLEQRRRLRLRESEYSQGTLQGSKGTVGLCGTQRVQKT